MGSHNKITIVYIINGQEVPVEANLHAPLKVSRDKALTESKNTGRPFDEWETRDADGRMLDPEQKVEDLGLQDGSKLFLSLRVGAGGCR